MAEMENNEEKKSKLSRFLAFICCCCGNSKSDDDDKKHDLVITRVYQSKSLTELARQRKTLISPKAVRSEITANEVEKKRGAKDKSGKNKRRFRLFRKLGARREVKSDSPRVQEELEVDMADGESLPEDDVDALPESNLMNGDAGIAQY